MIYKFTVRAKKAIEIASDLAIKLGHSYVGTEHILYGLSKEGNGVGAKVLKNIEINEEQIESKIIELIGTEEVGTVNGFTPRTKNVIENAYIEAKKIGYDYIGTEHILLGILKEGDSIAFRILLELDINIQKVYNDLTKMIKEGEELNIDTSNKEEKRGEKYPKIQTLNQFGSDLTQKVIDGKIDNVIGRDEEIDRVIQILARRNKNNPCLIGEPGVGKTAIVEGLAKRIAEEAVPDILKNKIIFSMDISGMVAGAKYRGDFEERIKKAIEEVKKAENIIIFIDEIHTIVGAGAAEGAIDAANILKPILARGEIQLIGATTLNEYAKYIEKDAALERRFSKVNVEESSKEDTINILKGIKDKYESHHNVIITDEAIKSAVELSSRYITDRFLPDKAIDLIDEASSKAKLSKNVEPQNLKEIEEKLKKIIFEKQKAADEQNFEKAAILRKEEIDLENIYEIEKEKWKNNSNKIVNIIEEENITKIVSLWTKIPVNKITEDENIKLKNLEKKLQERVIGQEEAIESVAKAIRRSRVGLKDPKRPIGSFLFLGPTGVGKTELSKALAENLFGNEDAIIKIDMSEYMEGHSVSKLIGSPPGYVGFDYGGQLTEKVRRKPYSVILFDEIEKAHADVMNLLLQILEDGILTDSQGRKVDFKNSIIIMTSNIGARLITDKKMLGFANIEKEKEKEEKQLKEYEELKKDVLKELKKELKPELINRIDEIIIFNKLSKKEIEYIIDKMLEDVIKKLELKDIKIKIEEDVKRLIIRKEIDKSYGARPIRRLIQNIVENKLAENILDGNILVNNLAVITVEDDDIVIKS